MRKHKQPRNRKRARGYKVICAYAILCGWIEWVSKPDKADMSVIRALVDYTGKNM
jgi:hypothetical protein